MNRIMIGLLFCLSLVPLNLYAADNDNGNYIMTKDGLIITLPGIMKLRWNKKPGLSEVRLSGGDKVTENTSKSDRVRFWFFNP